MRTKITGRDYTDRVIQVGIGFPTKGEGIENKVPGIQLKAKPGGPIWRKTDMVIATFIVASGLKTAFVKVTGKVSNKIQRKGKIFDPQIEESLIVAHARFGRLNSNWHDSPPDEQGSIGDTIQYSLRDKFRKGLATIAVGKR